MATASAAVLRKTVIVVTSLLRARVWLSAPAEWLLQGGQVSGLQGSRPYARLFAPQAQNLAPHFHDQAFLGKGEGRTPPRSVSSLATESRTLGKSLSDIATTTPECEANRLTVASW
jgi:hypothetical protein